MGNSYVSFSLVVKFRLLLTLKLGSTLSPLVDDSWLVSTKCRERSEVEVFYCSNRSQLLGTVSVSPSFTFFCIT